MAYVSETDFHGQTLTHLRNTSLNWGGDNLKGLTRGGGGLAGSSESQERAWESLRLLNSACKFTSGFIKPQILNFERISVCFRGPKAVLFCLAKFVFKTLTISL